MRMCKIYGEVELLAVSRPHQ